LDRPPTHEIVLGRLRTEVEVGAMVARLTSLVVRPD